MADSGSGDHRGDDDWKLGVFFGFLTSCVASLSKLAIRKSWLMVEDPKAAADAKTVIASRTMRWAGILGMSALNPIFDLLAMSYANPSLLAPFSGLALAWIVLLSEQLIGEPPQRVQVVASGLIGLGLSLTMAFGDHTNKEDVTVEDVSASYRDPHLLAYFAGVLIWMMALWYCINVSQHTMLQRFAWGMAGGSITGMQCFVKDALTLLKVSEDKRFWKLPWTLYLMIFLAIATAVGGLSILTRCMKRYDATFSNAMNAGSFVVSASIMSSVHYHTFSNLESKNSVIMYPTGLAIILVGLYILVRHTHEHLQSEAESEYDDDTVAELNDLAEVSMELTTVNEKLVHDEETVGLVARRSSATKLRDRTASASSVTNRDRTASSSSVEDNFGWSNRRPSGTSISGLAGNRDRAASSSNVTNRDRASSLSSVQF